MQNYGRVAILLHWAIAVLLLCQILLGFSMTRLASLKLQFELIQWHKSFGLTVLALACIRLAWHLVAPHPPPLASLPRLQRVAAEIVQAALLAATILVPLSGWALASTSTLNIPTLAFGRFLVPHLPLVPSAAAEAFWREGHAVLAYATLVLALGHAGAAIIHHFILGDGVLLRMLPGRNARQTTREVGDV